MTQGLPFEILKRVFSALPDDDLQECRGTCKQWNRAALEQMRETFCFYNVSEESAPELIKILESTPQDILRQVKNVNIDLIEKSRDEDSEEPVFYWDFDDLLKTVLRRCPNIVKISSSVTPPMEEVWSCISEAINEGHLQHLESIPEPLDVDMAFEYFPIAKAIKSRLKEIYISNNFLATESITLAVFNLSNCNNGPFSDPWLQEFTEIEKLYFSWYCVDETLLDCDAMIMNCYNSKKLNSITLLIKPLMNNYSENPVPPLPYVIQPCPTIKHFKCSWEMIKCDSIAEYLMEKFPCLESFTIEMEGNGWRRHENLSEKVLTSFMQHLSQIPTLNLSFFLQSSKVKTYLAPFDLYPKVKIVPQSNIVDDYEKVSICRSAENTCNISIITSNPMEYSVEKLPSNWKVL